MKLAFFNGVSDTINRFCRSRVFCFSANGSFVEQNFSKPFQDLNVRETQMKLFQRPLSVTVEIANEADAQLQ